MSVTPMVRTQYWNLSTNTIRSGSTNHGESFTDVESGLLPLSRATESSLHSWGVADGLAVSAVVDTAGLTVAPGAALDSLGRIVALAAGGEAIVDPAVDPSQMVNVPTVSVGDTGLVVPTDSSGPGTFVLTVVFREVQDQGLLFNAPVLVHTPWLRLLVSSDVPDDGRVIVLATVTLGAGGVVTALDAGRRHLAGLPAGRLELRTPVVAASGVTQQEGAALSVPADGGLLLTARSGDADVSLLSVDAALASLSLLSGGGRVSVAVPGPAQTTLHVEGDPVHSGGAGGGFSFADRAVGSYVDVPGAGERWVWYASGGAARLWSGADVLSIDTVNRRLTLPPGGQLSVSVAGEPQRVVHVEGSEVHSGGPAGGFSFADRAVGTFVEFPSAGQRWVWYADGGSARLWSGRDLLTVTPSTNGGVEFGRPDAPATLSLFGSRIFDVGGGVLAIQSGGTVVSFNGGDAVGIGTQSPGGQLGVESAGTAISATNSQDGLFRSAVQASGMTGVLAQGRNTGVWAAGGSIGLVASGPTAGQFFGDVSITGTLHKGGGGFRIDHPLDPANAYLSHSFVESPEMLNVYRGTVTTDLDGDATVELPAYVEALNADVSYHLTVVGGASTVGVTRPLQGNSFSLHTDLPGAQVCWVVLGVRQDAWAQAHRIQVEEAKPDAARGRYVHPDLFGDGAAPVVVEPEHEALLAGRFPGED
ncbi:hypothetical protein [Kribbella sp. NPDC000426]|uniref:hypothetical protein n=1 Tax=Kribbella sp. NPDC000426 TaxID=3154255 RepID=UPI0033281D54